MKRAVFTGSGVALITPFTQDGAHVDYDALRRLIEFQIDNDTDALILCGTTGEPSTILPEEKDEIIRFSLKVARGRVPVIAGAGGNDTRRTIEQAIRLEAIGANALLIVTPYYNKTTQSGLIRHYQMIADKVKIPIIMYNVPTRTGLNMLPETAAVLSEHENIVGFKEASADIVQIVEAARLTEGKLALYSGNDDHVLPLMALGASGVISVAANVVPRLMHEVVTCFLEGDVEGSRAAQFLINPLIKALFSEVNPIPVKAAAAMMGMCSGALRMPLVDISPANRKMLREEMKALGLIAAE